MFMALLLHALALFASLVVVLDFDRSRPVTAGNCHWHIECDAGNRRMLS